MTNTLSIKPIDATPLSVCVRAIRTCWNSHDRSDNLCINDLLLIDKVGNKNKHKSVLEHIRIVTRVIGLPHLVSAFKENKYSVVSVDLNNTDSHLITTNLRALHEMDIPLYDKKQFTADDYHYLIDDRMYPLENTDCYPNPTDRVELLYSTKTSLTHMSFSFALTGVSRALLQEIARHRSASLSVKSTRYTLKELKSELPFTSLSYPCSVQLLRHVGRYCKLTGISDCYSAIVNSLEATRKLVVGGFSNDVVKYTLCEAYKTDLVLTIDLIGLINLIKLRTKKGVLLEFQEVANEMRDLLPSDLKNIILGEDNE